MVDSLMPVAESVDEEKAQIRHSAMGYLARREHSRLEIRKKLAQKRFSTDLIELVVTELVRENLVSDERFTEAYARSRTQRGFGPVRIRQELRERGVAEELIEQYASDGEPHWLAEMEQVRVKRFGPGKPEDFRDQAKQMRYLQYRGFSQSQISRVFRSTE